MGFACVRSEVHCASFSVFAAVVNSSHQLLPWSQHVRRGGVHRTSSCNALAPVVEYMLLSPAVSAALSTSHLIPQRSQRHICGGARRIIASCELRSFRLQSTLRVHLPDVAASHSQTDVAAAETSRRHIRTLLLRQQRRCGVTLSHCCCGSRDVAASHSQTTVAAAVRAIVGYELCLTCSRRH